MPSRTGGTKPKTFDTGGKSSWPLPPSSVFRCRPAPLYIDPILFYVDQNFNPLPKHTGILVVGEAITEESDRDIEYIGGVEISNYLASKGRQIGVQCSKCKGTVSLKQVLSLREPEQEVKHVSWIDKDSDEVPVPSQKQKQSKDSKANVRRSSSQISRVRKWSPFQKDRGQSWKIFY